MSTNPEVIRPNPSLEQVQSKFPKDDLQLFEQKTPKPLRRRRSAPTSSLLKNLTKTRRQSESLEAGESAEEIAAHVLENKQRNDRVLIRETLVNVTKEQDSCERYLFLLSDILIIAKEKARGSAYKLKHRIPLAELWVSPEPLPVDDVTVDGALTSQRALLIGWPLTNQIVTFNSSEEKEIWHSALNRQLQMIKKKEQPQFITVKVCYKQLRKNDLNQVVTLRVGNSESASDTLKRCLDKFHIQEAVCADYQLWVLSHDDGTFFPLTGKECIYSIGMRAMRDAATTEFDPTDGLLCPHLRLKLSKCQEDPLDVVQEEVKESEPTPQRTKSAKKLPLGFLKRHKSPGVKRIFGQPLSAICQDGDLPPILLELILELQMKAPFTQGVFRKCANQKAVRELRERISNQRATAMDDIPVLVLAACFKEFLRSIPGGLLDMNLYDQWVASLGITDSTTRILRVKWVLSLLSESNRLLLCYVLVILRSVSDRSFQNQMNAFNLAICVGQSLLWPKGEEPADVEAATRDVPVVVQHLIENCDDVVGRERLQTIAKNLALKTLPEDIEQHTQQQQLDDKSTSDPVTYQSYSSIESIDTLGFLERSHNTALEPLQSSLGNVSRDSGLSGLALSDTFTDDVIGGCHSAPSTPLTPACQSDDVQSLAWSSMDSMEGAGSPSGTPVAPPRRRKGRPTPTLTRKATSVEQFVHEDEDDVEVTSTLDAAAGGKRGVVVNSPGHDTPPAAATSVHSNSRLTSSLPRKLVTSDEHLSRQKPRPLTPREGILAPLHSWTAVHIDNIDSSESSDSATVMSAADPPLPATCPFTRRTSAQRRRSEGSRPHRRMRTDSRRTFVEISDTDIVQQTENSAKARELYEESIRLSDVIPSGGGSGSDDATSPEQKPKSGTHYQSHSRRTNSGAAGMERKTQRRRSRRTRKRLSDSAIQHAKNKNKRGQNDVRRSKSDTCEHLSKIIELKQLRAPLPLSRYEARAADQLLSRAEPAQEELEDATRRRRSSVTSLANRNWHKDLKEQYVASPRSAMVGDHVKRPVYQYRGFPAQTQNGRRRWTPPAHPSKDLVIDYVMEPVKQHHAASSSSYS